MLIIKTHHTTGLYSDIFGQHDPGKTRMRKTSEEQNLLWSLKEKLQQR
jgi:hypothetical protein